MLTRIFSDINVRLDDVDNSDRMVVYDSKAVKQSLIRLVKTREGEIPYFRAYGLNLRQFVQMPINFDTGELVYDHVLSKIERFEERVEVLDDISVINIDYGNEYISLDIAVKILDTGEVFNIPTIELINNSI